MLASRKAGSLGLLGDVVRFSINCVFLFFFLVFVSRKRATRRIERTEEMAVGETRQTVCV